MAKDSGFNLVEMLNRRSKEQLKGEEEERREEGRRKGGCGPGAGETRGDDD